MATIGGARALYLDEQTGSLEAGKRADLSVVDMTRIHNWPHFSSHDDDIYSRLVYATKSTDVTDVICNGRWLMRERKLLTVDEQAIMKKAAIVAAEIDQFVEERESSPYNKLVLLAGVQRLMSFEVQVKVPLKDASQVVAAIEGDEIEVTKESHYRQYDSYFIFDNDDPDAARLRYRDDELVDKEGKIYQTRSRLTLLGEAYEQEYPNAVMLSRSRWLAPAEQSLRFYREYFDPVAEVEVHKDRQRWRILYQRTDFAVNIDKVNRPELPGLYLEVKSRTWSRSDAERKAALISELLLLFGVDLETVEAREYHELALAMAQE
jgi:5-methylthioadenosine/S-adenosylhomocysteine deaminase